MTQEATGAEGDMITDDDLLQLRKMGADSKEVVTNFNLGKDSGATPAHKVNVNQFAQAISQVYQTLNP